MKRKRLGALAALPLALSLAITALTAAAAGGNYVFDTAGILPADEWEELDAWAANLSKVTGCGVYIVTVEDFTASGHDIIDNYALEVYQDNGLGLGPDRDGLLLLLSMSNRKYYLLAQGAFGNAAFNAYGREALAEDFIDDFGNDNWYDGFADYLDGSAVYLEMALAGEPYGQGGDPGSRGVVLLISIAVGCGVALVVCLILKAQMNTARKQDTAQAYIIENGVTFRVREDFYTHSTQVRRKIQKSSGGGSRSGGSSTSGSF